jgi:hypothetical protein
MDALSVTMDSLLSTSSTTEKLAIFIFDHQKFQEAEFVLRKAAKRLGFEVKSSSKIGNRTAIIFSK